MYSVEKYLTNIKNLTNSLVIKLSDVGIYNNIGVVNNKDFSQKYLPGTDKKEWKYYLNLSGRYHPLDEKVKIKVIETENMEILTPELLDKNPLTKATLLKCEDFYQELLALNLASLNYIHGCMYPVDIDIAINAEDGTILNYNKNYIEENESYLIRELEVFIKLLISRWYNKDYAKTDELYLSSFIAFLYSSIYNKIINLHISRIYTNEVNSFHLEHFFRSKLDIWEDVRVLNKESLYWLYKNINNLIANTGQTKNLNKIINKLFYMNNVGVGEYKLQKKDPEFNKNNSSLFESNFIQSESVFISKKLNDFYLVNDDVTTSVENLIESQYTKIKETKNKLPKNMIRYATEIAKDSLEDKIFSLEKTKTLDIDSVTLFKKSGMDLFSLVLDYWIYLLSKDYLKIDKIEYPGNINKSDGEGMIYEDIVEEFSTDNKTYKVTPKVGLLMTIKLLLYSTKNIDIKLTKLNYNKVINTDRDLFNWVSERLLVNDGFSQILVKELKNIHPLPVRNINKIDDFKNYLESIIEYSKTLWLLGCNAESFITTSNIKHLIGLMSMNGSYELSTEGKTIDELLLEEKVIFNINSNTDILKTLKLLIKTFTGIKLDQDDELINNMQKYINIINKLTSYSVQAVNSNTLVKETLVYYNNTMSIKTKHGFIMTYGLDIKGLEPFRSRLWSRCVMFNEPVYVNNVLYHPYLAKEKMNPIKGIFAIRDNYPEYFPTEPHNYYITKEPYFKFSNYEWYKNYIKVAGMEIQALENSKTMKAKGVYSNHIDMKAFTLPTKTYVKAQKGIRGNMIVNDGEWLEGFQMYKMHTIPNPWFKDGLRQVLTVSGMNLKALEVSKKFKFTHGITESRLNKVTINKTNIKVPKDITGSLKIEDYNFINNLPIFGMPYKNKVFDIKFFKDKKYIKVSSMTFEALDKSKNNKLKTIVFSGFFGKKKDDGTIESVEVRATPMSDNKPFIRNNKVSGQGTITDINVNKEFLLGVSSLIYEVDGEPCKVSYVGVEDDSGNIDYYDTTQVPTVNRNDVDIIPHLNIDEQTVSGTSNIFETSEGKILSTRVEINDVEVQYPSIVEKKIETANKPKLKINNRPTVSYLGNNKPKIKK